MRAANHQPASHMQPPQVGHPCFKISITDAEVQGKQNTLDTHLRQYLITSRSPEKALSKCQDTHNVQTYTVVMFLQVAT